MSREFKTFLLISAEKSSKRLNSELFGRYLNALAQCPRTWFRLRDCDALARYTAASALACNDLNDSVFTDAQWELIAELGVTLYDAVAYYKHRAEGETNSTFGYVGEQTRVDSYRLYREVLWALDVVWARDPAKRCVLNFIRSFGGPIHMTTRRYRFVEDGLMIGKPETEEVVELTRGNFKLWHRVEETGTQRGVEDSFADIVVPSDDHLFWGFPEVLQNSTEKYCPDCSYAASDDSKVITQFGGIRLCEECRETWRSYMRAFPQRFEAMFQDINLTVLTV